MGRHISVTQGHNGDNNVFWTRKQPVAFVTARAGCRSCCHNEAVCCPAGLARGASSTLYKQRSPAGRISSAGTSQPPVCSDAAGWLALKRAGEPHPPAGRFLHKTRHASIQTARVDRMCLDMVAASAWSSMQTNRAGRPTVDSELRLVRRCPSPRPASASRCSPPRTRRPAAERGGSGPPPHPAGRHFLS